MGDNEIQTKAVNATITDTSAGVDDYPGTFEVVLSSPKLDRDGEQLMPDEWEQPLPDQITFVNDHTHKMASVVGSAKPTLEGAQIIARGTWAETDNAQDTRKIVSGKHVRHVSVAFREKRNRKAGTVSRELINGSFVVIPSNTDARVLASKSAEDELTEEAKEFIKSVVQQALTIKQDFDTNLNATGSVLPNGFTAITEMDSEKSTQTLIVKNAAGNVVLSHEFPAPEAPAPAADQSADQKDKGYDLTELRARAMSLSTRHENV